MMLLPTFATPGGPRRAEAELPLGVVAVESGARVVRCGAMSGLWVRCVGYGWVHATTAQEVRVVPNAAEVLWRNVSANVCPLHAQPTERSPVCSAMEPGQSRRFSWSTSDGGKWVGLLYDGNKLGWARLGQKGVVELIPEHPRDPATGFEPTWRTWVSLATPALRIDIPEGSLTFNSSQDLPPLFPSSVRGHNNSINSSSLVSVRSSSPRFDRLTGSGGATGWGPELKQNPLEAIDNPPTLDLSHPRPARHNAGNRNLHGSVHSLSNMDGTPARGSPRNHNTSRGGGASGGVGRSSNLSSGIRRVAPAPTVVVAPSHENSGVLAFARLGGLSEELDGLSPMSAHGDEGASPEAYKGLPPSPQPMLSSSADNRSMITI